MGFVVRILGTIASFVSVISLSLSAVGQALAEAVLGSAFMCPTAGDSLAEAAAAVRANRDVIASASPRNGSVLHRRG